MFGPVSGAHLNPVVSTVDWWLGRRSRAGLTAPQLITYLVAQAAGAVAGAVLADLMFGLPAVAWSHTTRTGGHLWLADVIATAGLVLLVFALRRNRPGIRPRIRRRPARRWRGRHRRAGLVVPVWLLRWWEFLPDAELVAFGVGKYDPCDLGRLPDRHPLGAKCQQSVPPRESDRPGEGRGAAGSSWPSPLVPEGTPDPPRRRLRRCRPAVRARSREAPRRSGASRGPLPRRSPPRPDRGSRCRDTGFVDSFAERCQFDRYLSIDFGVAGRSRDTHAQPQRMRRLPRSDGLTATRTRFARNPPAPSAAAMPPGRGHRLVLVLGEPWPGVPVRRG